MTYTVGEWLWLHSEMVYPPADGHPSKLCTNPASLRNGLKFVTRFAPFPGYGAVWGSLRKALSSRRGSEAMPQPLTVLGGWGKKEHSLTQKS